jgi:hypothetical protein
VVVSPGLSNVLDLLRLHVQRLLGL